MLSHLKMITKDVKLENKAHFDNKIDFQVVSVCPNCKTTPSKSTESFKWVDGWADWVALGASG